MNLLQEILTTRWAISPAYAAGAWPLIADILAGKGGRKAKKAKDGVSATSWTLYNEEGNAYYVGQMPQELEQGTIAHMKIEGPMTKASQWCGPEGTASMATSIRQAGKAKGIQAIIIEFDTPGGQVTGTADLALAIAESPVPVYGWVFRACSAGYWAVASATEIWMAEPTSEVGSIGVFCSWADVKPVYEKMGVKFHEVYASTSPAKNAAFRQAMDGDYAGLTEELDQIDNVFMQTVKAKRPNIADEAMAGGTYFTAEAIELGMADAAGSLQELIAHIKNKNMAKGSGFLARLFGGTPAEKAAIQQLKEEVDAELAAREAETAAEQTPDRVGELETNIAQLEQEKRDLQADVLVARDAIKILEERVAEAEAEASAWKKKAEEYGSQPGAMGTTPGRKGEDGPARRTPEWFNPEADHNKVSFE